MTKNPTLQLLLQEGQEVLVEKIVEEPVGRQDNHVTYGRACGRVCMFDCVFIYR